MCLRVCAGTNMLQGNVSMCSREGAAQYVTQGAHYTANVPFNSTNAALAIHYQLRYKVLRSSMSVSMQTV